MTFRIYLSFCWRKVCRDHFQRSRFTSSIWSQKSKNFALLDTKAQISDDSFSRAAWAKPLPQTLHNETKYFAE